MTTEDMEIFYLIVTGGTISGVGKGLTMSSIGVILKYLGWNVTVIKIDPYLNVDAGTMSPYEHGEVFVLADGGEVDLDLGNYERFLDITLSKDHNITSGKIYKHVIDCERKGNFLGKTIQVVPHVTNAIQDWIIKVATSSSIPTVPNICMIEVGGTVGDIESLTFIEALQELRRKAGSTNFCVCHVAYVPNIGPASEPEFKTKPTQHSIRELRKAGLEADFILCRSQLCLDDITKSKISSTCQIPLENVISVHHVSHYYQVPLVLHDQNIGGLISQKFKLSPNPLPSRPKGFFYNMHSWKKMAEKACNLKKTVNIGIVGKYIGTIDAYKSVVEALKHAAEACDHQVQITWIDSSIPYTSDNHLLNDFEASMESVSGILCPGGFGDRGLQGKIRAAEFCRLYNKPFFGICLGLQVAVIEFARNVLKMKTADSEEFNVDASPKIVVYMPEYSSVAKGGTMRLGTRPTVIQSPDSMAAKLYDKASIIYERHRHRYEVNAAYVPELENNGLIFSGRDTSGTRMEVWEKNHIFLT